MTSVQFWPSEIKAVYALLPPPVFTSSTTTRVAFLLCVAIMHMPSMKGATWKFTGGSKPDTPLSAANSSARAFSHSTLP